MPDHDAFLRMICDDPHSDAPRLVFADWLEEHGDPRGEYIRKSIELAEWGVTPRAYGNWTVDCRNRKDYPGTELKCHIPPFVDRDHCEYHTFKFRCAELLARHEWAWTPECLREHKGGAPHRPEHWTIPRVWRRGFIGEVTVPTCEAWVGGPCRTCSGTGKWKHYPVRAGTTKPVSGPGNVSWCKNCNGTGRIPDIGPTIMAATPVTMVRVADREPYRHDIDRQPWCWSFAAGDRHPHWLPHWLPLCLASHFQNVIWNSDRDLCYADFDSRDHADAALSEAMIRVTKKSHEIDATQSPIPLIRSRSL